MTTALPDAPDGVNAPLRRDVTVVIAAWRAAGTIGRAVSSALAQPEAAEVVVVDDASNDDGATIAAARAADDGSGRLLVIGLDQNSGPARARNTAIRASKAAWVTILDSDDFLQPGRLARLLAISDAAPAGGYDLIADDLKQVADGAPLETAHTMLFAPGEEKHIDVSFTDFIRASISNKARTRSEMGFVKPLMRRAFLEKHGLLYNEGMRLGEDFDLYARALLEGARMRLVPWTGYMSVLRRNSLSLNHSRADIVGLQASGIRLHDSGRLSADDAKLGKMIFQKLSGRK
jgi:succinoglycan biosynthesis protein ExoU